MTVAVTTIHNNLRRSVYERIPCKDSKLCPRCRHAAIVNLCDFGLPQRCAWNLRSFEAFLAVGWQVFTEVSGQHIGPILKNIIMSRNVGKQLLIHNAQYPRTATASTAYLPWTKTDAPKSSIQSWNIWHPAYCLVTSDVQHTVLQHMMSSIPSYNIWCPAYCLITYDVQHTVL